MPSMKSSDLANESVEDVLRALRQHVAIDDQDAVYFAMVETLNVSDHLDTADLLKLYPRPRGTGETSLGARLESFVLVLANYLVKRDNPAAFSSEALARALRRFVLAHYERPELGVSAA